MRFVPHTFLRRTAGLLLAAAAGLGAAFATAAAPAHDPSGPGAPWPAATTAGSLAADCRRALASAQAGLLQLRQHPADAGWLRAHDAYSARLEDAANRLTFLSAVHPDKPVRDASEACERRWNAFFARLGQDAVLYRAARAVRPVDDTERELHQRLLLDFEDAGVGLPPAQRRQARQLNQRIADLVQHFERNIRDAQLRVPVHEADLQGVPPALWQAAPRNAAGQRLLGLDAPTYTAVLQQAESAAVRQRMWRAKTDEGGPANLQLLAQIAALRQTYARLFGADSWAAFAIRRSMAQTPQRVQAFLGEVQAAVQGREQAELAQLRAAKAAHLGQRAEGLALERWDVAFYTERVRRARYAVDQEAFRVHFPPQESLQFSLRLAERLLGLRFERRPDAQAWHPEVQAYAVHDAASAAPLGTLWVDLYPREGKYNHAAVWGLRSGSAGLGRQPQSALVVNFNRQGLTLDELETLLHELGHALHHHLSSTRFAQQSGLRVLGDFVEAPSQMLESWVYDQRVLALMAEVCPACQPVPEALLAQADAARRFGQGIFQSRQHLYASYDLALYGPGRADPLALWAQMEGATPLGHVAGSMFPAGFSHSAGGYSAGYYGYLWSMVVAADLRTAFAADRLDAAVGQRYRSTVLARGSERPPTQLVRDFLGRDFNARAFFDELAR